MPVLMQPPFIFRIDEICAGLENPPNYDRYGNWKPSTDGVASRDAHPGEGTSGQYWLCDGWSIIRLPQFPADAQPYKTFSVYYVGGVGYWVLQGDARNPTPDENFHMLRFDCYDSGSGTSYLTNAGQMATLRLQPQDSHWVNMLLPRTYHSSVSAQINGQGPGGLIGDLPIFIALMALTTSPSELPEVLPWMFTEGSWRSTHPHIRVTASGRGVVVSVHTCPPGQYQECPTGSSKHDLYDIEIGKYGKYFV